MAELTGDGKLELEVTDFGPIIEAKLDLRPLTVFVGPSNTGKSYLAILIYALHRVFGGIAFIAGRYFRGRPGFPLGRGDQDLSKESSKALLEVVNSLVAESEASDQNSIVLPPPAADALRSGFNELADTLSDEIRRCFGIGEVRSLTRKGQTRETRIVMRRRIGDQSDLVAHRVSFAQEAEFMTMVPAGLPIPINFEDRGNLGRLLRRRMRYPGAGKEEASLDEYVVWEALQIVGDMVLPSLFGPLHLPAYYLPADRTGVMHAHSVVVSA